MDLGIRGKYAVVCGASKGLGRACARSLAREGVNLVMVARERVALNAEAAQVRAEFGVDVIACDADISSASGREAALAAYPTPDILVNNCGGPPPGDFRDWDRDEWIRALDANMIAPILIVRAVIDGMIARRFGRIVNITSGAVKQPLPDLGLSNGARAGLTGFVSGLARTVAQHNVTINNLLPGTFETDRLRSNYEYQATASGKSGDELVRERLTVHPARRFGRPDEFGDACAYLCSAQAGYLTAQNVLLDGGSYPGTF